MENVPVEPETSGVKFGTDDLKRLFLDRVVHPSRTGGNNSESSRRSPLAYVAMIVVPIIAAMSGGTAVLNAKLDSFESVLREVQVGQKKNSDESIRLTAAVERLDKTLHEVKGAQQHNSAEVIKLTGLVSGLGKDVERLEGVVVTEDGLRVERIAREGLERRIMDLFQPLNTLVNRNVSRVESLRIHHVKKEDP